jgi:hypothetical protein
MGVWLRAEEPRKRSSGGLGGGFFSEGARQSDGASWRKGSTGKERSLAHGNPRSHGRQEVGESGATGYPYHTRRSEDTATKEDSGSTNQQLDSMWCETFGNQGDTCRGITDGGKESAHVVQELVDECGSYHVPMQNQAGHVTKAVTHMHVETSEGDNTDGKRPNLINGRALAVTGKNRVGVSLWPA